MAGTEYTAVNDSGSARQAGSAPSLLQILPGPRLTSVERNKHPFSSIALLFLENSFVWEGRFASSEE